MPKLSPIWDSRDPGPDRWAGQDCGPYATWRIADNLGFASCGVSLERLPPGSQSSLRHWHSDQDEFVYVIAGTLVLVEDVETMLGPGDIAAWKAGEGPAHCLVNRSGADAVILVGGARGGADTVTYPDHDIRKHQTAEGSESVTRLDGSPIDADR